MPIRLGLLRSEKWFSVAVSDSQLHAGASVWVVLPAGPSSAFSPIGRACLECKVALVSAFFIKLKAERGIMG